MTQLLKRLLRKFLLRPLIFHPRENSADFAEQIPVAALGPLAEKSFMFTTGDITSILKSVRTTKMMKAVTKYSCALCGEEAKELTQRVDLPAVNGAAPWVCMKCDGTAEQAPRIEIRRSPTKSPKACREGEMECVICGRPVKIDGHKLWLWVHLGGNHAVTNEEGARLNASGESDGDLGAQPIGRDCLKKHPELKPYVGAQ